MRASINIGILIFIFVVAIFEHNFHNEYSSRLQMNIYIPVGFIAVFISFYIFREYNRVKKAKRDERRDEINQRRQELLDNLFRKKKNDDTE